MSAPMDIWCLPRAQFKVRDTHRLGDLPDLQRNIDARLVGHPQDQVLPQPLFEAGNFSGHRVGSRRKRSDGIAPCLVGDGPAFFLRQGVEDDDMGSRQYGAGVVRHSPGNRAGYALGRERRFCRQKEKTGQNDPSRRVSHRWTPCVYGIDRHCFALRD